jgi:lipid-binding SYLF domain-containing protein
MLMIAAGTTFANEASRLDKSATAIREIRGEIGPDIWAKAHCVLVIPELKKAAFIVGGEYGKGVMSCRAGEQWSAPVFMQIAKGSWGFQAGAEQADLVLLVMNESGVQKLLKNKVNLGADASVAAGPAGRRGGVSTDAVITAEIISYSRSKGLFAGVDVSGGVLRPDEDANKATYGASATPATILATREMSAPPEAAGFLNALKSTGTTGTSGKPNAAVVAPAASRAVATTRTDDEVRARVVDLQQSIDRILAETTPAPVGTSGTVGATEAVGGAVTVDRARLMHVRQQIDGLLASLNSR